MDHSLTVRRRDVLQAGLGGGAAQLSLAMPRRGRAVALIANPDDDVAEAAPAQWALDQLHAALSQSGAAATRVPRIEDAPNDAVCVWACGAPQARAALNAAGVAVDAPEGLALFTAKVSERSALIACGADARGLGYALLELADRLESGASVADALAQAGPLMQRPANAVRSIMRQFVSEPLDKPWFNDREMWRAYLGMLARQRFNRFHLALGLGYDTLRNVTDSYLVFAYPFLIDAPGHRVRATNLSAGERDANLAMLRFISDETTARGITFQLGLWMHGYELMDSPNARYLVEGLSGANHAAYCRDALAALLRACPSIASVALRIHGESGIAEGSYEFWATVFDGVRRAGRTVEIDLHAKGLDQTMIEHALATGMPVNVSPKYWAEHLGMPYHQAAIRDLELPAAGQVGAGLMTLSEGARSFTRYGYADFLRDDRRYTVRHRVFAGTQKLLASGDPAGAAAYARRFSFCGSSGMDLMEPLTCRGRRGTATADARDGYADRTLAPHWDWQKYLHWYRVWGRAAYDPYEDARVWTRSFNETPRASALMAAIARASRILPIVTTAHLPSAACDAYWPEVYWNQPLAGEPSPNPYGDTPRPKTFQNVSPLDPQLFENVSEHADQLLQGTQSGKYTPVEVAQWLEDLAASVGYDLRRFGRPRSPETRRLVLDAYILAGLGRFFAAKFRAGVLFALYERTQDKRPLDAAVERYRVARTAWAALSARANGVYASDLSVSDKISERGAWADRLAAIDADIDNIAARAASAASSHDAVIERAVSAALARPPARQKLCDHTHPAAFQPGQALPLEVTALSRRTLSAVTLFYRHVNQAERFQRVAMTQAGATFRATVSAAYTNSPFPLQYYFMASVSPTEANIFPGLGPDLMDEPYIVLSRGG